MHSLLKELNEFLFGHFRKSKTKKISKPIKKSKTIKSKVT